MSPPLSLDKTPSFLQILRKGLEVKQNIYERACERTCAHWHEAAHVCTDAMRVPLSVMHKVLCHFINSRHEENNERHGKKAPGGTQFRRERAHEQSMWMHEYQSALNKIRTSNSIFQSGWSVWSGGLRLLPFVFVIVVNYGSATSQWLSRELLILRRTKQTKAISHYLYNIRRHPAANYDPPIGCQTKSSASVLTVRLRLTRPNS